MSDNYQWISDLKERMDNTVIKMAKDDEKIKELESRLSHLSAVNEKLAEALKNRVHCLACQTHEHPKTAEALKLADEMGEP